MDRDLIAKLPDPRPESLWTHGSMSAMARVQFSHDVGTTRYVRVTMAGRDINGEDLSGVYDFSLPRFYASFNAT